MKYGIYAYLNHKLKCYSTPKVDIDDDNRQVVTITRALKSMKQDELLPLRNTDLYRIATWDDETGVIVPENSLLVCLDDVIGGLNND